MSTRRYALDPELLPMADSLPAVMELGNPAVIAAMRSGPALSGTAAPDRSDVRKEDRLIPGRAGDPDIAVRIYRPTAASASPRGCIFEIHGGGFMFGDIAMMDPWCQAACGELGAVVVSVEYRLAPEHPFPAALHDCYAALCWIAANAAELGIDSARIVIAGQSAGAALAAATTLYARDHGGPAPCFQLLEIPVMDDRLDTPSMRAFTDTPFWNLPNAEWGWKHYLGAAFGGEVSAYAAPARATDLSGLPPAYISTMEFDPLRDEGIMFALGLLQSGVPVELHSFAGTFHGSSVIHTARVSQRASAEVMTVLARALD